MPKPRKEQEALRAWAEREFLVPFLKAIEDWSAQQKKERKGKKGSGKKLTVQVEVDGKPMPCYPRGGDSDVCLSPIPPFPPPPPPPTGRDMAAILGKGWPKLGVKFTLGR